MTPFSICLVEPAGYRHSQGLAEVCQLLGYSLETLGRPCSFEINHIEAGAVNIVLGYHLLDPLTVGRVGEHRLIFYQLEQLSDQQSRFTPEREALLRAAWGIWDYSQENVGFLRARGFERVVWVPLGYHRRLERIAHRPESEKDIDVLFYGSTHQRREAVLEVLRPRCRVESLYGVYGAQRDRYIARSRMVLNIHFYDTQILEQVRISYLLSNRCFVISEAAGGNPFDGGLVTGPHAELAALCEKYLADPEARRRVAARGHSAFRRRLMVEHLKPALAQLESWG